MRPSSKFSRVRSNQFSMCTEENNDNIDNYFDTRHPEATEATTERQLVLLCLDYLRSLRRSHCIPHNDLDIELGFNQDYITIAIWALSNAFSRPPELSHLVTLSSHWSMQQVPTHWSPFYNQISKITPIQDPYFAKGIDAYLITMYRHVLAQIGDTPIEMASGTYFPDQNTWQYQREPFHGDHGQWIQMVDFFD